MDDIKPVWTALAGVALIAIGAALLASPFLASIAVGLVWGALLVAGGVVLATNAAAVREPGWGWQVAGGVIAVVAGVLLLADPVDAVVGLTLALTVYLVAVGGLRIFAAAVLPVRGARGLLVLSGLASIVLGYVVAASWPVSGLVALGVMLGIDVLLAGCARLALAIRTAAFETRAPVRP